MRLEVIGTVVAGMWAGSAAAGTSASSTSAPASPVAAVPGYPEAYVDRPLVLLPGMTELDVDEQFRSTQTSTLGDTTPDVSVRHAFGSVELMADVGYYGVGQVSFDTRSVLGVVSIGIGSGAPQPDHRLSEYQFARGQRRLHLIPGRLAAFYSVGVSLTENRMLRASGMLQWIHVVDPAVLARAEVQLTPRLALLVGAEYNVPMAQSAFPHYVSSAEGTSTLVLALGPWDLYGDFDVQDLTGERRMYLDAGFAKRWGG